jgi:hypothetical protein
LPNLNIGVPEVAKKGDFCCAPARDEDGIA